MKNKLDEKKKGLAKIILLVIAVPILMALGVVIGGYITSINNPTAAVQEEVIVSEQTVDLDQFVLNLEPTGGVNRYIRLELALSTVKKDGVLTIEDNINKIRDVVIYKISKESVENIFEAEAAEAAEEEANKNFTLKRELKEEINEALGEDIIHQVYISNIVIQ